MQSPAVYFIPRYVSTIVVEVLFSNTLTCLYRSILRYPSGGKIYLQSRGTCGGSRVILTEYINLKKKKKTKKKKTPKLIERNFLFDKSSLSILIVGKYDPE